MKAFNLLFPAIFSVAYQTEAISIGKEGEHSSRCGAQRKLKGLRGSNALPHAETGKLELVNSAPELSEDENYELRLLQQDLLELESKAKEFEKILHISAQESMKSLRKPDIMHLEIIGLGVANTAMTRRGVASKLKEEAAKNAERSHKIFEDAMKEKLCSGRSCDRVEHPPVIRRRVVAAKTVRNVPDSKQKKKTKEDGEEEEGHAVSEKEYIPPEAENAKPDENEEASDEEEEERPQEKDDLSKERPEEEDDSSEEKQEEKVVEEDRDVEEEEETSKSDEKFKKSHHEEVEVPEGDQNPELTKDEAEKLLSDEEKKMSYKKKPWVWLYLIGIFPALLGLILFLMVYFA